MPTGHAVHCDQPIYAAGHGLLGPLSLRHVVVDSPSYGVNFFDHPCRVAERGDEETNALLERDFHPPHDPFVVASRRPLDERVHANWAVRHLADVPKALSIVVAENVGQGDRLDDPDASRFRDRRDELRIATRIHRSADDRETDAGLGRESRGWIHAPVQADEGQFMRKNSPETTVEKLMLKNLSICG